MLSLLSDGMHRLRALFRRSAVESEIDEELRFHVERQIESYMREGLDRASAVRRAQIEFGTLDQAKEEYRDALGVRLFDDVMRDVRCGIRSLRAAPLVTAVAILSLALAIGANTAVFSILNGLLLRTLPVHEPERLVLVTDTAAAPRVRVWDYPIWEEIRQRDELFDETAAWSFERFNLSPGGQSRFVDGIFASGSFFSTFGVMPALGRTFTELDDQRTGGPEGAVTVISYGYWQQELGGASDVIGSVVRLNGAPFTIVGVTAPPFSGPEVGRTFAFIVPLRTEALILGSDHTGMDNPGTNYLTVVARLRAGQSVDAAAEQLRRVQPEIRNATLGSWKTLAPPEFVERYLKPPFTLVSGATSHSALRGAYRDPLLIIAVVVAVVLLIACVNVANVLLARATARRNELSLRMALGASRWRLARERFAESLILSTAGGALGIAVAAFCSRLLVQQLSTPANTVFLDVSLDGRVLAFTAAVSMAAALLFGTAPAVRAASVESMEILKERARSTERTRNHAADGLVIVQAALSVVLLVAAGWFLRSFSSLATRDLGMKPDQVLVVAIDPPLTAADTAQRVRLYERTRDAVRPLPDVADSAISYLTPVGGGAYTPAVETSTGARVAPNDDVFGNLISAGWFRTFGIPLVAGRDFTDGDRTGAPPVAIVNEAFVRKLYGARSPLGEAIVVYPDTPRARSLTIVGVVADAVYTSPHAPAPPTWYVPMAQFDVPNFPIASARLSIRARTASTAELTRSVAEAISTEIPGVALTFRAFKDQIAVSLIRERLLAQLAGFFGGVALLLAGLGVYGVTAYAVTRQYPELGIRAALGATPAGIIWLVLGRLSRLLAVGVLAGLVLAGWTSRFVDSLIYSVEPRDPGTFAGAAGLLLAVAFAAGWLPARRAARTDPMSALRET